MFEIQNPVLIVIDMQNGFMGIQSRHIIDPVINLIEECQRHKIPTVFTRFHNHPASSFERLIGWKRLREAPETDLVVDLQPYAKTVIDKDFYSAFTNEFNRFVNKNNWKTIILCGVATESCVMKTAVDAFERSLTPLVVSDACASHAGTDIHQAGLMILGRFIGGGQIVTTKQLLQRLNNRTVSSYTLQDI